MKNRVLFSMLFLVLANFMFAAKEDLYLVYEDFETGTIDATWTQEFVTGEHLWGVELNEDALFPLGGNGSYRGYLRNDATQTIGFTTKLISPEFNLSGVVNPVLVFSHAQAQRTGDYERLKVYYRTHATGEWVLLKEYNEKITDWVADTLQLVAPSANYQIAFEATDVFGHGVVLDDIIVRPAPTCNIPSNITATSLTNNSAQLNWLGSLDADSFQVVLSIAPIESVEDIDEQTIVLDTITYDFSVNLKDLTQNQKYYVYIRSFCYQETSDYAAGSFWTLNEIDLPYSQSFNLPYSAGYVKQISFWTHGTSILTDGGGMAFMPFVNTLTAEADCYLYSHSKTTCQVFAGNESTSAFIPAGEYVYTVTPLIKTDRIQDVDITFWLTTKQDTTYQAAGLIVGVMTIPTDFSTFVPVDTVYVQREEKGRFANWYERFSVSLKDYVGEGKYIAFASNFKDKKNIVYLDDVTLERHTKALAPRINEIRPMASNRLLIDLKTMPTGYSYNVVIAKEKTDGKLTESVEELQETDIIYRQNNIQDWQTVIESDLFIGQDLQVYIQSVENGQVGYQALPVKVLMPQRITTFPWTAGFEEENDPYYVAELYNYINTSLSRKWWRYINMHLSKMLDAPNSSSFGAYKGSCLSHSVPNDEVMCYAFPEVETIQNKVLTFYLSNMWSSETYDGVSKIAVGVMTDPYDVATFEEIAQFEGELGVWKKCQVVFNEYTGKGRFIAIKPLVPRNTAEESSDNKIDELTISELTECMEPLNVNIEATYNGLKAVWEGLGELKYQVKVATDEQMTTLIVDSVVDKKEFSLYSEKRFDAHTTYYMEVGTICAETIVWQSVMPFTTECRPSEYLPYFEGFEDYKAGGKYKAVPACWTMPIYSHCYGGSSECSNYPYISLAETYAFAGAQYLVFGFPENQTVYFALPPMSEELNKLQVHFWMKGYKNYVGEELKVGVMSDPEDVTTFELVETVKIGRSDEYEEYIVELKTYQGEGKHIALVCDNNKGHTYNIDNLSVEPLSACSKIKEVKISNMTPTGAMVLCNKNEGISTWEVLVTDVIVDPNAGKVASENIMYQKIVEEMPVAFEAPDKMVVNTVYYVYVRQQCSENVWGDWSNAVSFKTMCTAQTPLNLGLITFAEQNSLGCWTVGVREGTTNDPKVQYAKTFTTDSVLYMFNTNKSDGAYAIMPPLDIEDICKCQVSFDAVSSSTTANNVKQITVGVITNPTDLSTFTPIETIDLLYGPDSLAWQRHTVEFDSYKGDYNGDIGKYVMFISESGDKYNYVYLDNIEVSAIPQCPAPKEIWAEQVESDRVVLKWQGSETNQYTVELFNDQKQLIRTVNPTTNTLTLDQLDYTATYFVRVKTACSEWGHLRRFRTSCPELFKLPYEEDFDDMSYFSGTTAALFPNNIPSCWDYGYYNSQAMSESNVGVYVYSSAKYEGENGLYVRSTSTKQSYIALPLLEGNLKENMISFWYRANAKGVRKMVLGIAEDVSTFENLTTTFTALDTLVTENNQVFEYYSYAFNKYAGNGKYIVLHGIEGQGNSTAAGIYLDNLRVEKAPSCFMPANLEMLEATPTSVTLLCSTLMGTETAWDFGYVLSGEDDMTKLTIVPSSTKEIVITDLQASTEYDFYVRAHCSETDQSEWFGPIQASTLCLIPLNEAQWTFDVPGETHPTYPGSSYVIDNCWIPGNLGGTSGTMVPYRLSNIKKDEYQYGYSYKYSYSGDTALCIYSKKDNAAYVVLPSVDADADGLQLCFKARSARYNGSIASASYNVLYAGSSNAHAIKVGMVDNPYNMSTYTFLHEHVLEELTSTIVKNRLEGMEEKDRYPDAFWEDVVVPLYGTKGKYIVLMSDYDITNYIYIDDVKYEQATGLAYPVGVHINEETLTYESVELSWISAAQKWQVQLLDVDGVVVKDSITETTSMKLEQLQSNTNYTLQVCALYGEEQSEWVSLTFHTPCSPVAPADAHWNFEDNMYQYGASASYLIPNCWEILQTGTTTSQSYAPYAIANTTNYIHARSATNATTERALQFYIYNTDTTKYNDVYAIMPELSVDYENSVLHFWGRAAYFYSPTHKTLTYQDRLVSVNNKYNLKLEIGVMSDATDFSTFVPMDTCEYSKTWASVTGVVASGDPTGNAYWEEFVIPLAKYKDIPGKLAFRYSTPGNASRFYIDDLEIIPMNVCLPVTQHNAKVTSSTSVLLSWEDLQSAVQLKVGTTEDLSESDLLVDSVVNEKNTCQIDQLQPATVYYYSLRRLYAENENSEWSEVSSFMTDHILRFAENFENINNSPLGWEQYEKDMDEVLNKPTESLGYPLDVTKYNWFNNHGGNGFNSSHMQMTLSTTTRHSWMVSPSIDLVDVVLAADNQEQLMFSVDMIRTNGTDEQLPAPEGTEDVFMIAVSTDGGNSWTSENTICWNNNGTADYYFNDITTGESKKYYFDFSKYVGKQIKIAFYAQTEDSDGKTLLHIDNVQLNRCQLSHDEQTICSWVDYADDNFQFDCNELKVGKNSFVKFIASHSATPDKLLSLDIMVEEEVVNSLTDVVCQGEEYNKYGFKMEANTAGVCTYKQKLQSANGCDSIVQLNLTVTPRQYTTIEPVICQGAYYTFGGENYYTNTVKQETFTSLLTGCDSIVSMYLTVKPALQGEEDVYLCPGQSYDFGEQTITEEGEYTTTLKNTLGCDSVVTLHVYSVPNYQNDRRSAICEGEEYADDVFQGLSKAGEYPANKQSVYGCDSTIVLHLFVVDETMVLEDKIGLQDLPYVINGQEILPLGTSEGTYTNSLLLSCGVVQLKVIVGDDTNLNNLQYQLAVSPNPVKVGAPITINTPSGVGTGDNILLQVFDSEGRLVERQEPDGTPVVIEGLPTTGVYMIYLQVANKTYQTKVVVR